MIALGGWIGSYSALVQRSARENTRDKARKDLRSILASILQNDLASSYFRVRCTLLR